MYIFQRANKLCNDIKMKRSQNIEFVTIHLYVPQRDLKTKVMFLRDLNIYLLYPRGLK